MRVRVVHTTTYRYAAPVRLNPHRLMVRPRGSREVEVRSHDIRCEPAADMAWAQDVFGNPMATATFADPARSLIIASDLSVDLSAVEWPVFPIAPRAQSYSFHYEAEEVTDLGALRGGPMTGEPVAAWADAFVGGDPTDTLALLKDVNAGVSASLAYLPRDVEGVQSGAQTLALASGSCRDFAALFIEAVRHLGFGARAVSGYLFVPDSAEAQGDTTHAWAEVYLPDAGWIAFDPTHGRVGGAGLIPVATARRNAQIMPVVGSFAGHQADFLGMDVSVSATRIG